MLAALILFLFAFFSFANCDCPYGSYQWQNKCYTYLRLQEPFERAEHYCNSQIIGGHLASIHDGFVNQFLAQEASENFNTTFTFDFWIGATNLISSPNWTWTDGSPFDFTQGNFNPTANTNGSCISETIKNGLWNATDCFQQKSFICAANLQYPNNNSTASTPSPSNASTLTPPVNICSEGWVYYAPTKSCYGGFSYQFANWNDAEMICQNQTSHLISIHSQEELLFVEAMSQITFNWFWVGLYSSTQNVSQWQWSDGSPVDYLHWLQGAPQSNPNTFCTNINIDGTISNDLDCTYISQFYCKKPSL